MPDKEKEGYWTPLEKQARDYLLTPVTWPFKFIPYAANLVTLAGFGFLIWGVFDFVLTSSVYRQIWFLVAAWITDFLDGPIARNNRNVTALGTAMDHVRDYCIMFWMMALLTIVARRNPDFFLLVIILSFTVLGLIGVIAGTYLYEREKRSEKNAAPFLSFIEEFLLRDLVTTVTARIHTAVLALGGIFYVAGTVLGTAYKNIGLMLLTFQLFILGFYLHEIFQSRYEEQAYKIRVGLQSRVDLLEKKLDRLMKRKRKSKKSWARF